MGQHQKASQKSIKVLLGHLPYVRDNAILLVAQTLEIILVSSVPHINTYSIQKPF